MTFSTSAEQLDHLAKQLYMCVLGYYEDMGTDGKTLAERSVAKFWEIAGLHAQELIDSCVPGEDPEPVRYFSEPRCEIPITNRVLISPLASCRPGPKINLMHHRKEKNDE